jgi:hypothetical protein
MRQQLPTTTPHPRTRSTARLLLGVAFACAVVTLPACSSSSSDDGGETAAADTTTTAAADASASEYCDTARAWAVEELDGGADAVAEDPVAFEAYLTDYVDFAETSLSQSPPELQPQHELNVAGITDTFIPIFEKYDYDQTRIEAEATPEEQALLNEPPPDVRDAQAAIHAYESTVCGTETPPPADVTFEADPAADAYCQAVLDTSDAFGQVAAGGFDPADLEAFLTDDAPDLLAAQDENVPDTIAEDSDAVNAWTLAQFADVLAAHDYDIRDVILNGTQDDREDLQFTDPAIIDQRSQVDAYDQQVCGA